MTQSTYRPPCVVCGRPSDYALGSDIPFSPRRVFWCEGCLPDWARRAFEEQERERAQAEKRAEEANDESNPFLVDFCGRKFKRTPSQGHIVVQVGDLFYDWTLRQYQPHADLPTVRTAEQLIADGWEFCEDGVSL